MHTRSPLLFMIALLSLLLPSKISSSFVVSNNCPFTIWPGTLAGSGTPALPTTGFRLDTGKSVKIVSTPGWSGRIWARTGCQFDSTGSGTCLTGDCGGKLECGGNGAAPPTSLFEITLGKGNDKDFYDVSLVDGYNLPIVAWPLGVNGGACNATGCVSDLNMGCPKELQVVGNTASTTDVGGVGGGNSVVACKSACEAFGLDQYCCSGRFANPNTCKPSFYSALFKRACPSAYSYAFDDGTSTFTCKAYDYAVVFCPTTKAKKSEEYMSPPPPSAEFTSPPPPSAVYTPLPPPPPPPPSPSAVYMSPTPPTAGGYIYPSTPPYQKHTNEASMGEASSSSILQPASLLILLLGTLLMSWR